MKHIQPLTSPVELACLGPDAQPSPFGLVVAGILSVVFQGLHHVDQAQLRKVKWNTAHSIALDFRSVQFATVDFNELTRLVILAHDAQVRIAIASPSMQTIRLIFHPRKGSGGLSESHPSLEDHAALIRSRYAVSPGEIAPSLQPSLTPILHPPAP